MADSKKILDKLEDLISEEDMQVPEVIETDEEEQKEEEQESAEQESDEQEVVEQEQAQDVDSGAEEFDENSNIDEKFYNGINLDRINKTNFVLRSNKIPIFSKSKFLSSGSTISITVIS